MYHYWYIRYKNTPKKALRAIFYSQASGVEPVKEWLLSLSPDEEKTIEADIMSVKFGWPIGMPIVKNLGKGLWEVKSNLSGKIARVFFCIIGKDMILLHGIIKKSQ